MFSYVVEHLNFTTTHTISSLKKYISFFAAVFVFFFNKLKYRKYIPQVVPWKLSFILLLLYGKAYL